MTKKCHKNDQQRPFFSKELAQHILAYFFCVGSPKISTAGEKIAAACYSCYSLFAHYRQQLNVLWVGKNLGLKKCSLLFQRIWTRPKIYLENIVNTYQPTHRVRNSIAYIFERMHYRLRESIGKKSFFLIGWRLLIFGRILRKFFVLV